MTALLQLLLVHSTDTCARIGFAIVFVCFSRIKKMVSRTEMRTRVNTNSLRHLPRRSSKNSDLQFDRQTDILKENYSIDIYQNQYEKLSPYVRYAKIIHLVENIIIIQATQRQITEQIELPVDIQTSSMKDTHRCAHETRAKKQWTCHIVNIHATYPKSISNACDTY